MWMFMLTKMPRRILLERLFIIHASIIWSFCAKLCRASIIKIATVKLFFFFKFLFLNFLQIRNIFLSLYGTTQSTDLTFNLWNKLCILWYLSPLVWSTGILKIRSLNSYFGRLIIINFIIFTNMISTVFFIVIDI